ncbi:MAG: family 43 glycosylhydrolase [Niabella sp.]
MTEGTTVIKAARKYYLFYSANDYQNADYAVGCAVSDSVLGPWQKLENQPLLSRNNTNWPGSGHGDLFKINDSWYCVFHTHYSASQVSLRRTAIVPVFLNKDDDGNITPVFEGEKIQFLKLKSS